MKPLSGYQRAVITRAWLRSDKKYSLEEYIKKVCSLKKIKYLPSSRKRENNRES